MRRLTLAIAALLGACGDPAPKSAPPPAPTSPPPSRDRLGGTRLAGAARLVEWRRSLAELRGIADRAEDTPAGRARALRLGRQALDRYLVEVEALEEGRHVLSRYVADEDRRRDVYRAAAARAALAGSTAVILDAGNLARGEDRRWRLAGVAPLRDRGLCASEPFQDQPEAARCTAFLVRPDLIATAAHCVGGQRGRPRRSEVNDALSRMRVVFAFAMTGADSPRVRFADGEAYEPGFSWADQDVRTPIEVLDRVYTSDGVDFAVVRLDSAAAGRSPLPLRDGTHRVGTVVFAFGSPTGLPLKEAYDGIVLAPRADFFSSNLDLFRGNSGSPVFDKNGVVLGLASRGLPDYEKVTRGGSTCYRAKVYPPTSPHGFEEVTNAAAVVTCLAALDRGERCRCQRARSSCFAD